MNRVAICSDPTDPGVAAFCRLLPTTIGTHSICTRTAALHHLAAIQQPKKRCKKNVQMCSTYITNGSCFQWKQISCTNCLSVIGRKRLTVQDLDSRSSFPHDVCEQVESCKRFFYMNNENRGALSLWVVLPAARVTCPENAVVCEVVQVRTPGRGKLPSVLCHCQSVGYGATLWNVSSENTGQMKVHSVFQHSETFHQ